VDYLSFLVTVQQQALIIKHQEIQYKNDFDLLKNSVDDSISFSISTRLRPKLMTALGAIIALSPLALGIGTGAQLHQPLAIAVIGGFIMALPLLLIVLPSMLRILFRGYNPDSFE
jgi:multidrug efflux pump subunit AcrB